jgi:hypothetical protein
MSYDRIGPDITRMEAEDRLGIWEIETGRLVQKITLFTYRRYGIAYDVTALALSPENRLLFAAHAHDPDISVWEVASGQLLGKLRGHRQCADALAVSPDGRYLASGSRDTTVLIWDLQRALFPEQPLPDRLTPKALASYWAALREKDAVAAAAAVRALAAVPGDSLSFLRQHLTPATRPDPKEVAKLLADLDDSSFKRRQKATVELEKLSELILPAVEQALREKNTLEKDLRLQALHQHVLSSAMLGSLPDRLRQLRAVEVLEKIGTAEAQEVLTALAQGVPVARLTREARTALRRLRSAKEK